MAERRGTTHSVDNGCMLTDDRYLSGSGGSEMPDGAGHQVRRALRLDGGRTAPPRILGIRE